LYRSTSAAEPRFRFDGDWLAGFSAASYKPMRRLLAAEDFDFLARQPGCTPDLMRSLRRRRVRAFRAYLRDLTSDFARLEAHGKVLLASGAAGRELAELLFRQRWAFTQALFEVRLRLLLYQAGIGRVETARLLGALETLGSGVRMPAFSPAAL
jgi:hypothetical protein